MAIAACQWCGRYVAVEEVEVTIRLKDGGDLGKWALRLCGSCQFERVNVLRSRVVTWYREQKKTGE